MKNLSYFKKFFYTGTKLAALNQPLHLRTQGREQTVHKSQLVLLYVAFILRDRILTMEEYRVILTVP